MKIKKYRVLKKQYFSLKDCCLLPIRYEDRYKIMKWRNEQIYHLRQKTKIKKKDQDEYFKNKILKLFNKSNPDQILFSFLRKDVCVGYGGLVHIDWVKKNAEISFVMKTTDDQVFFVKNWIVFLNLIEEIAFNQIKLKKIYTFSYNLRPKLYEALKKSNYLLEELIELNNEKSNQGLIHSKKREFYYINLRHARIEDSKTLFNWRNDFKVRNNSINSEKIVFKEHNKWFINKLKSRKTDFFLVEYKFRMIGQIRLDMVDDYWEIDYSVSKKYRNRGFGSILIQKTLDLNYSKLRAKVKVNNLSSVNIFMKFNFKKNKDLSSSKLIVYDYENRN